MPPKKASSKGPAPKKMNPASKKGPSTPIRTGAAVSAVVTPAKEREYLIPKRSSLAAAASATKTLSTGSVVSASSSAPATLNNPAERRPHSELPAPKRVAVAAPRVLPPTVLASMNPAQPSESFLSRVQDTVHPAEAEQSTTSPTLASFGLTRAAGRGVRQNAAPALVLGRNSTLFSAIIPDLDGEATVVFRAEVNDPVYTSWSEKILFDAVSKQVGWVKNLELSSNMPKWFDGNKEMKNSRGYPIRLFLLPLATMPTPESVDGIVALICDNVNAQPGNSTNMSPGSTSAWLPGSGPAVWSDVLGTDNALGELFRRTGFPRSGGNFFFTYRDLIRTYFHPNSFSVSLQTLLQAPETEVHQSQRDPPPRRPDPVAAAEEPINLESSEDSDLEEGEEEDVVDFSEDSSGSMD
jgi:hypothetical protein